MKRMNIVWSDLTSVMVALVLLAAPSRVAAATGSPAVALVQDGTARAVVVLPEEAEELERLAADELVSHLAVMTGVELPVVVGDDVPQGLLPLYLGAAADEALDTLSLAAGDNPSTFTVRVDNERIDIRGLSDEGTLIGVYELLEQLGFRWYIPGDLGRVVPEGDSASVAIQTETQAPSMELRLLQPWQSERSGWIARQRLGGERRSTGGHGIPPYGHPRTRAQVFETNPEFFALIGGERRARQICAGNPDAAALTAQTIREGREPTTEKIYIGMGPNDGGGYCECELCAALDGDVFDPFYGVTSRTGRYIGFFNRVLDHLEDDFPNLHIVWYVYASHMMPPPSDLQPNPRIVGVFAPIAMDRLRGMDNPMSPDRHALRWLIDEWAKTNPNELYYRGYYNNLACVQLPKTQIDRVRTEIPALHERGVNVMRVECIGGSYMWDTDPLTLYLAARLMWNVETDVDAVLSEFYRLFYGPAEAPMRRYHEQLEAAFRDTPYFTGSTYVYFPVFKDHPRRDTLRAFLDEAVGLTAADDESAYAQRVRLIRKGYERMDLFLDMSRARNRHDFAVAYAKMEAYTALSKSLTDVVVEGSGRRAMRMGGGVTSYFNRFFRQPVESGYARAVEIGEVVATMPDEWSFLLDPAEIGEISGYHRPGELGGNWQPIKTSTRSWSDQGLHYYKGIAWYRQKVDIPTGYQDRPVYLWFGGVDRLASVWINGHFMGTSREPREGLPGIPGSFRAFDMPTVDESGKSVLQPGAENWVSVRIENTSLAELGTGGILAPVMFWTPNDPGWDPRD